MFFSYVCIHLCFRFAKVPRKEPSATRRRHPKVKPSMDFTIGTNLGLHKGVCYMSLGVLATSSVSGSYSIAMHKFISVVM